MLIFGAPAGAHAAAGGTGAEFLRIVQSPRAAGMGEAGAALADDPLSAVALNPAGLSFLSHPQASFVHNAWLEGISLQQLAYVHPTERHGTPALALTMLRVDAFPGYDNTGGPAGDVEVGGTAVQLAYGRRVIGPSDDEYVGFYGGASLAYVRERLEAARAGTVLGDLGMIYTHRLGPGLASAGYSARSLGRGLKFDSERDPAPTVHRFALGYHLPFTEDVLSVAWDLARPRHAGLSHQIGVEYGIKDLLFWRLGFTSHGDPGSGFRFGAGFNLRIFTVDYALAPLGEFGFTHRIALSARFGGPLARLPVVTLKEWRADRHLERGMRLLQRGRHYEAALEFDKVLRLEPQNAKALRLLRRIRDALKQDGGYR